MYFDTLTLAAVADELRETILGGRIQRVLLPNQLSIALEIYASRKRYHLLLSAHPQFTRAHLSQAKLSRGVEHDTPLLLLLRKYLLGGRITAIEQPELERILLLSIVKGPQPRNTSNDETSDDPDLLEDIDDEPFENEHELRRSELIIETMERRGNIILVSDDNIILESIRHIPPRLSRRPVLPHQPYELPPQQEKRDPRQATPEGLRALLNGPIADTARAIVGAYRGVSPLAAREVVFRTTGAADTPLTADLPWARLALALRGLWNDEPQPSMAPSGDAPSAYAPYLLTHLPGATPRESMSAALDTFYRAHEQLSSHQQRRAALSAQLHDARERLQTQHHSLTTQLARAAELDQLRWEGEMIYAFMHSLHPGQTTLEVDGRIITLDPRLRPVENAQERFRAYDKAKGALAGVPERLREVELRLDGLDETLAMLALAEGFEQIEGIGREVIEQGFIRAPGRSGTPKQRRQAPLRVASSDGYTIYVGRSAGQNEQVTFKLGSADDLWLHARGLHGAHVIIKTGGRPVPEQTLREAAELAAYFSQARGEAAVEIDIARRTQVRRIPNGPLGLVSYHAERTVRATPKPPAI